MSAAGRGRGSVQVGLASGAVERYRKVIPRYEPAFPSRRVLLGCRPFRDLNESGRPLFLGMRAAVRSSFQTQSISMFQGVLVLLTLLGSVSAAMADELFSVELRTRDLRGAVQSTREKWVPAQTALIVCDMWDTHTCRNAVLRSVELAPRMNALLEKARMAGALVIHAPSSCMAAYDGSPARKRAQVAPASVRLPDGIDRWCKHISSEDGAVYPLDQEDGGSDDEPAGSIRTRMP